MYCYYCVYICFLLYDVFVCTVFVSCYVSYICIWLDIYRDVEMGDIVIVGECRLFSKIVRFNVLKVFKGGVNFKKGFKKY